MAILDSELKLYKSATVTDDAANGGRMSSNQIVSGVANNVWPNAFKSERLAGSTKYRKVFAKVANDDDLTLMNPQVFLDIITQGDDWVTFFAGTQRNTQTDITGSERKYGVGTLGANVSSGAGSLTVVVEDASLAAGNDLIFQVGDKIRITDKTDPNSGTGNEEEHIIDTVEWASLTATITLDGTTLAHSYTAAAPTRVMSMYEPADVACSVDNWVETSASGTYNEGTNPVLCDNIGTIEQTWTLTFSSATAFSVSGDVVGSVGSGTISGDFAPTNATFSKPYFTLRSAGWGGTWANGETVVFQTHPAAIPIWEKRVIPAACGSLSGNKTRVCVLGESS